MAYIVPSKAKATAQTQRWALTLAAVAASMALTIVAADMGGLQRIPMCMSMTVHVSMRSRVLRIHIDTDMAVVICVVRVDLPILPRSSWTISAHLNQTNLVRMFRGLFLQLYIFIVTFY